MPRSLTHLLLSLQLATACAVPPTGAGAVGMGHAACVEGAATQAHVAHEGAAGAPAEPTLAASAPVAAPCAHLTHGGHRAGAVPVLTAPATAIDPAPWLPVVAPVPVAAPVRRPQRFVPVPGAGPPVPVPPLFLRTARLRL